MNEPLELIAKNHATITALAALASAIIAIIALAKTSALHKSAMEAQSVLHEDRSRIENTFKQGEIALQCLDKYLTIQSRQNELGVTSLTTAYDAERAMCDLLWTEYHLWKTQLVSEKMFRAWLESRRYSFNLGAQENTSKYPKPTSIYDKNISKYIRAESNQSGDLIILSYRNMWLHLSAINYFPESEFVELMRDVHETQTEIREILSRTST